MNYGEYHHSVNRFDRDNYEKIIRDSRRFPEVLWEREGDKIKYEFRNKEYVIKSKIRAFQSRNEFQNLLLLDEILLRFYGSFALILNSIMRNTNSKKTLCISDSAKKLASDYSNEYIDFIGVYSYEDISLSLGPSITGSLKLKNDLPAISLTNYINQSITKHSSEHVDTDYFYRISRAKKNRYVTQEEASKLSLNTKNTIQLGNIVMDRAITSVGNDLQSILYRYSVKGQSATHKKNPANVRHEEEILYVIKNNEKLNYMDIAGFKLDRAEINSNGRFTSGLDNRLLKGRDALSSGELIIPSHTPFRVTGIQKMDRTMNRRVVFLEPMKLEEINQTDIVQNNFDGELFSRTGKFNLEEFAI